MAIDYVHDLQFVFRQVLQSMSRPGEQSSIESLQGKSDLEFEIFESTFLVAQTLLDREVSFHVISEKQASVSRKLTGYTLARQSKVEEADFIIVLQDANESDILSAVEHCKKGSLTDPHRSATWLIETAFGGTNGPKLHLTGPGIKETNLLQTNLSQQFWQHRDKAVIEYPLGIDLILMDEAMQLVCVPRTTKAVEVEVK